MMSALVASAWVQQYWCMVLWVGGARYLYQQETRHTCPKIYVGCAFMSVLTFPATYWTGNLSLDICIKCSSVWRKKYLKKKFNKSQFKNLVAWLTTISITFSFDWLFQIWILPICYFDWIIFRSISKFMNNSLLSTYAACLLIAGGGSTSSESWGIQA